MKAKELLAGTRKQPDHKATGLRAKKLLDACGKRQDFVARHMKVSESLLSMMLRGERPWNARKAELFLEGLR